MSLRAGLALTAAFFLVTSVSAAPLGGSGVAPPCNRACMIDLVDRYLAALVRHSAAGLPLNRDVKFTENTARLKVGSEGLWVGASELPTGFRIYAIDVDAGEAGFYGVMKERDRPLIIALRLKVVNGQITEIEHVLARGIRAQAAQNLAVARPEFTTMPARSHRLPRQQMVDIADSYFEAIEHADGKLAPFADDCVRRENGMQTTHNAQPVPWPVPLGSKQADQAMAYIGTLSCSDQLDTHVMDFITRLWPRRHEIVDRELGLVFSFPMFQHRGGSGTIKVYHVPGVDSLPLGGSSSNMQAGEIFKIDRGQIVAIEAMGVFLPYGTKSGWGE
ncbi:MAG TPA: hypothetical protein VMU40_01750 [Steroidobacteraceae bacterium]|nr:hypothetical protein [Steroidobacteraceae bacterium]